MAEIATLLAGEITPHRPPLRRWNPRVNVPRYWLLTDTPAGPGKMERRRSRLKAITGGDAVSVDPKYRDAYPRISRR